ncbi:hypothetical protein [Citrobacter freundii]|uniref:Uncharacterized protein n=1 Tax=Citrobacter freundii TaxID=546 RepID=A0A7G2IJ36_CITFR|nr:hypothetical protein [Citrobacter freundii]
MQRFFVQQRACRQRRPSEHPQPGLITIFLFKAVIISFLLKVR